jgi:hypothetical protein
MIQINSITFKPNGQLVARFTQLKKDSNIDGVFPGKGSADVEPSIAFADALDAFVASLQSLDLPDVGWTLSGVSLLWDAEGVGYGYLAKLSYSNAEKYCGLALEVKQTSPDMIEPKVQKALEQVRVQAVNFVLGASNQGSLFDSFSDEELEVAA